MRIPESMERILMLGKVKHSRKIGRPDMKVTLISRGTTGKWEDSIKEAPARLLMLGSFGGHLFTGSPEVKSI